MYMKQLFLLSSSLALSAASIIPRQDAPVPAPVTATSELPTATVAPEAAPVSEPACAPTNFLISAMNAPAYSASASSFCLAWVASGIPSEPLRNWETDAIDATAPVATPAHTAVPSLTPISERLKRREVQFDASGGADEFTEDFVEDEIIDMMPPWFDMFDMDLVASACSCIITPAQATDAAAPVEQVTPPPSGGDNRPLEVIGI